MSSIIEVTRVVCPKIKMLSSFIYPCNMLSITRVMTEWHNFVLLKTNQNSVFIHLQLKQDIRCLTKKMEQKYYFNIISEVQNMIHFSMRLVCIVVLH